jgi:hypothetical protein
VEDYEEAIAYDKKGRPPVEAAAIPLKSSLGNASQFTAGCRKKHPGGHGSCRRFCRDFPKAKAGRERGHAGPAGGIVANVRCCAIDRAAWKHQPHGSFTRRLAFLSGWAPGPFVKLKPDKKASSVDLDENPHRCESGQRNRRIGRAPCPLRRSVVPQALSRKTDLRSRV